MARYCSEACQAADWRRHEQECYRHQLAQLDDDLDDLDDEIDRECAAYTA